MKKILALILVLSLLACLFVGCKKSDDNKPVDTKAPDTSLDNDPPAVASDVKIGVVLIGDENEGYTYSHIKGIQDAVANLGLNESKNVVWKYTVKEDESCYDAISDCIDQGCTIVFTNSYGHQSFAQQAATEFPDVEIVSLTGDTARASGLSNFHNAFTEIYEARYVSGVVAGMKVKELIADGKLTDKNYDANGNVKIGYVGAYPYAEVVSGFTAFFLGIKSECPNVVMDVQYTNSWFDITAEGEAAIALIDRGCVIIGQHADSTGAPAACQEKLDAGTTVYSVGYNVDMLAVAPTAALVSPTNVWSVFYTYAIDAHMKGEAFETNWSEGYDKGAVMLTDLGPSVAAGTAEEVERIIGELKDGTLHVFDTSTFTVGGEPVTSCFATDSDGDWKTDCDEAVFDGYYHESYFQSAPSFQLIIDGITALN